MSYITEPNVQVQIGRHAGNGRVGQVGSVEQAHAVDGAEGEDEAPIYAVDDATLLLDGELGIIIQVGLPWLGIFDSLSVGVIECADLLVLGRHGKSCAVE